MQWLQQSSKGKWTTSTVQILFLQVWRSETLTTRTLVFANETLQDRSFSVRFGSSKSPGLRLKFHFYRTSVTTGWRSWVAGSCDACQDIQKSFIPSELPHLPKGNRFCLQGYKAARKNSILQSKSNAFDAQETLSFNWFLTNSCFSITRIGKSCFNPTETHHIEVLKVANPTEKTCSPNSPDSCAAMHTSETNNPFA